MQWPAATATGHTAQAADAVPAKPKHKVGQLRARLDAVLAEQAERQRRREADTAAAKAELASRAAEAACQAGD